MNKLITPIRLILLLSVSLNEPYHGPYLQLCQCQAKKAVTTNKSTSIAGHFDSHGGAKVQYCVHLLMQHDQCYTRSHWMPPSGNYSLGITPAAPRATINTTIMQNVPTLLAVSMAIAMRHYYTARIARWQWRRFVAFINATIGRALAPIASTGHAYPYFRGIFHRQIVEKSLSCPNNNRGVTYQTDEKPLNSRQRHRSLRRHHRRYRHRRPSSHCHHRRQRRRCHSSHCQHSCRRRRCRRLRCRLCRLSCHPSCRCHCHRRRCCRCPSCQCHHRHQHHCPSYRHNCCRCRRSSHHHHCHICRHSSRVPSPTAIVPPLLPSPIATLTDDAHLCRRHPSIVDCIAVH